MVISDSNPQPAWRIMVKVSWKDHVSTGGVQSESPDLNPDPVSTESHVVLIRVSGGDWLLSGLGWD